MNEVAIAWPGAPRTRPSAATTPAMPVQAMVLGWRSRVDARLAELLPAAMGCEGVGAAMRDAVLAPGKRLRPLLMLAAGRALGHEPDALLDAACAVEMVHAASLVLDDMPCMDDARLRRGRPAVHLAHGEDAAVLAAVALLAQATTIVAALPGVGGNMRSRLVAVLCDAVGPQGLVRGQYRDLREGAETRTVQAIAEANDEKTGVLFACALEMAALLAGAPQAVRCLRAAASQVGQAFQLKDDLDDGIATATPAGKDLDQDTGKSTMVALLGRPAVERLLHGHLDRAEALVRSVVGDSDVLVDLLRLAVATPSPSTRVATEPAPSAAGKRALSVS